MKVERENRTLHLSEIPTNFGDDISRKMTREVGQMSIDIEYSGDQSSGVKAIVLDNVILPLIQAGLMGCTVTSKSTVLRQPKEEA